MTNEWRFGVASLPNTTDSTRARQTRSVINQNFLLGLTFVMGGLVLAAMNFINPVIAGITDAGGDSPALANWVLSWSDEFNAVAGTKPDPKVWSYDLGGGGWGGGGLDRGD